MNEGRGESDEEHDGYNYVAQLFAFGWQLFQCELSVVLWTKAIGT